jgi:hypothetical protein
MSSERVGNYQPRVDYQREPEQQEVRRRQEDPAKPTPEQARAESIAKKPRPAVKTLGSRIDVYA